MRGHCGPNRLIYSHPVYLTIHRSEVPSKRLTTSLRKPKLTLYEARLKNNHTPAKDQKSQSTTTLSAVAIEQRAWATFLDIVIIACIFLAVRATSSLETFLAYVNDVTVIEAEDMRGDNFYKDKFASASAGELALALYNSTLSENISLGHPLLVQPFARVLSQQLDPQANIRLHFNDAIQVHANINTQGQLATHKVGSPTAVAPRLTLKMQMMAPPMTLGVDQILLVPLGSQAKIIERSSRFEMLDQLFRLNRENGWMKFLWHYLPAAFLVTNLVSLTLFRGTPGCYLARIRIVDLWG
jgi:hypothetical protein